MADLVIPAPLAEEIRSLAAWSGLTAEGILTQAVRQYSARAQQQKIQTESVWWTNTPPDFRAQYAGQYVAVHQQQVVDQDADEERLFERVSKRWPNMGVLITPAAGRPTVRIRHPRVEPA